MLTINVSDVMLLVGAVLYCVRFVASLQTFHCMEVKPRSLTEIILPSSVELNCEISSFCILVRRYDFEFK